jgi:hypothetical protein
MLAFVVITVAFVLQQSSLFSKSNSDKENNVLVARTVMENIKSGLKTGDTVTLYGSAVSLSGLKANSNAALPALLIPNSANPKVRVDIRTLPIPSDTVSIRTDAYHIGDYFRLVQVTATEMATNRSYSLKAYVEYN